MRRSRSLSAKMGAMGGALLLMALFARALDIAETTVKIHVQHILRKLQFESHVQAAGYAAGRVA